MIFVRQPCMHSFIQQTFLVCLFFTRHTFLIRQNKVIQSQCPYFLQKKMQSEARKIRCFAGGCEGLQKIANLIQGDISINANTKPVSPLQGNRYAFHPPWMFLSVQEFLLDKFTGHYHLALFFPNQVTYQRHVGNFKIGSSYLRPSESQSMRQGPRYLHFYRMLPSKSNTGRS